jgi:hypothetical protein
MSQDQLSKANNSLTHRFPSIVDGRDALSALQSELVKLAEGLGWMPVMSTRGEFSWSSSPKPPSLEATVASANRLQIRLNQLRSQLNITHAQPQELLLDPKP